MHLVLLILISTAPATDTLHITKQAYGAGYITVPTSKTWHIKQVTANYGGYAIVTNCIPLKKEYYATQKIYCPTYCPDSELIQGPKDNESNISFTFYIDEY